MATQSFNTRMRHDSDAAFREWGLELSDALQAVGCVKTADTGQIDWATVTRAGVNSDAGYEIRYLNDSLHGTSPCYIKLYYGTHGGTDRPRLRVEVGQGSDGSGNLTGTVNTAQIITSSLSVAGNSDVAFPSYVSFAKGTLAVLHKLGRASATDSFAWQGFIIARPMNLDGSISGEGWRLWLHNASTTSSATTKFQDYHSSSGWSTLQTSGNAGGMIWSNATSATATNPSGDNEMSLVHVHTNRTRPCYMGCMGAIGATTFSTFTTNPVGVTPVTYLIVPTCLGYMFGWRGATAVNTVYPCIPWE